MNVEQQFNEAEDKFQKMEFDRLKRDLRLFVVGGYDGLSTMYYNYFQVVEKVKFSKIVPFDTFMNEGDIADFFLNKVFFEVDNKYQTNIGADISSLAYQYIHSVDTNEIKKTNLLSIVNKLEEAIEKSHGCQFSENPILFEVVKKIENYYRVTYSELFKDFHPFLSDRPENKKLGNNNRFIFKPIKETVALKVGVLFYTGQIKVITGQTMTGKFMFNGEIYGSGHSLAEYLNTTLNEKVGSIKSYLNSTYNKTYDDKNVFYSQKLKKDILDYCASSNKKIVTNKALNASEEN